MKTNKLTTFYISGQTSFFRRFKGILLSFCTFLVVFLFSNEAYGKTSRALIIGIDIYKPADQKALNPSRSIWRNLGGCVNDAGAIKDLIISRYLFPPGNISTLFNQEASRDKIIEQLNKLVAVSQKGD